MTDPIKPLDEAIDEVTEQQLRKALAVSRNSISVTANILGIPRSRVYRLMRKFGIE